MKKNLFTLVSLSVIGLVFSVGCNSQSEPAAGDGPQASTLAPAHDPHDVPLTEAERESLRQSLASYADAVTQIKSFRDSIQQALASGKPAEAHRPLDELDVVLEHMPVVARDNNVPRTQWETVNTSAQQLRDSFNQVHAQIDASEEPDYGAVAADIAAALSRLEGVQVAMRSDDGTDATR